MRSFYTVALHVIVNNAFTGILCHQQQWNVLRSQCKNPGIFLWLL